MNVAAHGTYDRYTEGCRCGACVQTQFPSQFVRKSCANCRFYAPGESECRRHAPQIIPVSAADGTTITGWPDVLPDDWCGEFLAVAQ